jgi:hypothetical protein
MVTLSLPSEGKKEQPMNLPLPNVPTALVKMLTENSSNISCPYGMAILDKEASPRSSNRQASEEILLLARTTTVVPK